MFAGILLLLLLLPFLMLSILTFHDFPHHNIQQEFCFNPKLASIIGVYSGLGKVMPIWRGGGINQKLLLNFARRSAAGSQCQPRRDADRAVAAGREPCAAAASRGAR